MTRICRDCDAIEIDGHWTHDADALSVAKRKGTDTALCPGCDRVAKHRIDGVVTLTSGMLDEHREDALNLIRNVARRRQGSDVAARIASMEEHPGEIVVTTTDRHLAERIGKEFEKAFAGDLDIQWPKGEEFVRVFWRRD